MSFRTVYGYTHSENGWRMCNRDECVVANPLPHTNTAPIRRGDAATILNAWIIWYHNNVEPLSSPVWGWSATNDVPNSNHLSGTAVDINAPKYPWGYRTMPAHLITRVRNGLRLFEGTVFWGADWSRADEMHYQLGFREGDSRIARFAKMLNEGHLGIYGAPKPVPNLINECAAKNTWLGKRLTVDDKGNPVENTCPDKVGRWAKFEHGYVYWHPNHAAWAIPNRVFETWAELGWEMGRLGYPVNHHTDLPEGVVQAFRGGVIYRKNGQPGFEVHGLVGERWMKSGFENGPYGWPTSNEVGLGDGTYQDFEKGRIYWAPKQTIGVLEAPGRDIPVK